MMHVLYSYLISFQFKMLQATSETSAVNSFPIKLGLSYLQKVPHQIGNVEKELHPVTDGHLVPVSLGRKGGLDGLLHQVWRRIVELGHLLLMVVWLKCMK